jgi:hypothetical protein
VDFVVTAGMKGSEVRALVAYSFAVVAAVSQRCALEVPLNFLGYGHTDATCYCVMTKDDSKTQQLEASLGNVLVDRVC